ncbi:S41 family peptidase [Steroidobacter flavus]|uniref:S41 family peptidase n=1 Tax=Steroidobacter flavus TaxID=1842136 RepID=A0ABV8T5S1_9GAMM
MNAPTEAAPVVRPFQVNVFRPALVNDVHAPDAEGLWRFNGYGSLFEVGHWRGDVNVYNQAGNLCWRDPAASGEEANNLIAYVANSRWPARTAFANTPDGTQFHVEKVQSVPAACLANRNTPLYIFDAVTTSFVDFYPYSVERQVDWSARRARLRPRAAAAKSDQELKAILVEFMKGLEDPHTGINGMVGDEPFEIGSQPGKPTFRALRAEFARQTEYTDFFEWLAVWRAADDEKVFAKLNPATRTRALNGAVMWGVLDGNVGYLSIGQMMGFEPGANIARERELIGQVMDEALGELRTTDALVLDIAANLGGYAQIASDIAGRFADRRRLAYTTHAPRARGVAPQPFYTTPAGQVRYRKPVLLLTSDVTVSAGEKFTLMMRVLPNVVQVGRATQGALAGGLGKGLPNGWEFGMPNEVTLDAYGQRHEVTGIRPDLEFDVYRVGRTVEGRVRAVLRAARFASGDSYTTAW